MNLAKTGAKFLTVIGKNAPFIISAAAGIGLVALYFLTIKETEEAVEVIEETPEEESQGFKMVKKIAKIYAPSFICLVFTLFCIVSSAVMSHHRIRDLTASYAALAAFTNQYRRKQVMINGPEKDMEIIEAIAQDKLQSDAPEDYYPEDGLLCYMPTYPYYFSIPEEKYIYKAFLKANEYMNSTGYVDMADWFKWAHAVFYDDKGEKCGMNPSYIHFGWEERDLNESCDENGLYPRIETMEDDISGLVCTIINVPAPKPLELLIG